MTQIEAQLTSAECVNQGFDLLAEKDQGFPEFDEVLKGDLLDELKKEFQEAWMNSEQIELTVQEWFPESSKNNPFFQGNSNKEDISNYFQTFAGHYPEVDFAEVVNSIQKLYDGYKESYDKYLSEWKNIESDAHQWIIDCHLDASGNILDDYSERIRSYAEGNEIPKYIIDEFIHTLGKTKGEVERWEHKKYGVDVRSIGFELPMAQLGDKHYRYLWWLWTAVLVASADKYEKDNNK